MRRKPFGELLPSAHAVDREYRLLSALFPLGFPVPEPLGLCDDPDVLGAIFYVMEMAKGRPYADGSFRTSIPRPAGACTSSWSIRSPSCTTWMPTAPVSATSESPAIISSGRSRAGRASIAIPRPTSFLKWSGSSPTFQKRFPSSRAPQSSTATIASTMSSSTATEG